MANQTVEITAQWQEQAKACLDRYPHLVAFKGGVYGCPLLRATCCAEGGTFKQEVEGVFIAQDWGLEDESEKKDQYNDLRYCFEQLRKYIAGDRSESKSKEILDKTLRNLVGPESKWHKLFGTNGKWVAMNAVWALRRSDSGSAWEEDAQVTSCLHPSTWTWRWSGSEGPDKMPN
jgi:hypothetical protein